MYKPLVPFANQPHAKRRFEKQNFDTSDLRSSAERIARFFLELAQGGHEIDETLKRKYTGLINEGIRARSIDDYWSYKRDISDVISALKNIGRMDVVNILEGNG